MKLQPTVSPTPCGYFITPPGALKGESHPPLVRRRRTTSGAAAAARTGVSTSLRCGALKTRINLANYTAMGARALSDFPWVICEAAPRSLSDTPKRIWIAVQKTDSKDTKLPW